MKAKRLNMVSSLTSKFSLACLLSACFVGNAFAQKDQNSLLYFEDKPLVLGEAIDLPLYLEKSDVAALQMRFELPEGVSLADPLNPQGCVVPNQDRILVSQSGYEVVLDKSKNNDRLYQLLIVSQNPKNVIAGDTKQQILDLRLKIDRNIDQALVNNAIMSIKMPVVKLSSSKGEKLSVTPDGSEIQNMRYLMSFVAGTLSAEQAELRMFDKAEMVHFSFNNQIPVRDFQFTLCLPEGIDLCPSSVGDEGVLLSDRLRDHKVSVAPVKGTNNYNVMVSSSQGSVITVADSRLFSVNVKANEKYAADLSEIEVKNIVFSNGSNYSYADNRSTVVSVKNMAPVKAAKDRLDQDIAVLQNELNAVNNELFGEQGTCVVVKEQFAATVTAIQKDITSLSEQVQADYEAGSLNAQSKLDETKVSAIQTATTKLKTDAEAAVKNLAEANQAAKTRLDVEVKVYQDQLAAALASPYAPDPYYTDLAVADVKALADDVQAQFEAGKLNAGSTLNAAKETAVVNSLSKVNSDVLYNHSNVLVDEVYNTQAVDPLGFSQHVAQYNRAAQSFTKVQNDLARATNEQLVDVKFLEMLNRSIDKAENSFLSFVNGAAGNKAAYEAEFKLGYDKSDLVNAEYVEANYITEDQETLSAERARLLAEYEKLVARHNAYLDVVTVQTLNGELDALRGQLKEFEAVAGILIKNHAEPKVTDANELVNYILEKKQLPSEVLELKRMMKRADLNSDGRLTTRDYNEIIKLVLGQH